MGKWKYRKPEPKHIQGMCVKCGERKQKKAGDVYKSVCSMCDWSNSRFYRKYGPKKPAEIITYRSYKKDSCEFCGFIPEHPCQLDVDHIDGNHSNDDPSNLQTLCANCHRLKTFVNQEGIYKKSPEET